MKERGVYLVGTGALGVSLGHALLQAGYRLTGAWNRSAPRANNATSVLGTAVASGRLPPLPPDTDLVLVCVADIAISDVGRLLVNHGRVRRGLVVAHTSGCLPAATMGEIPDACCASFHPLRSVPSADLAIRNAFADVWFALEGDPRALNLLASMASALGGHSFVLTAAAKPHYHAAAVLASNLMIALLEVAIREAQAAAVPHAPIMLTTLACAALTQTAALGPPAALTGPLIRGDVEVIRQHLRALSPHGQEVYRVLSRTALTLAEQRGLAPSLVHDLSTLLS